MRLRNCLSPLLIGLVSLQLTRGQSPLSANSGINSNDSWVTAGLTISSSGSATFSSPIYLAATNSSSNTVNFNPRPTSWRVELGYDSNGGVIMNLWPRQRVNGQEYDASTVGFIRYAGGQLTLFDQSNDPLSVTMPSSNMSTFWPLAILGNNPGPSVLGGIVVPNIQSQANAMSAGLTISSGSPATASLQVSSSQGGKAVWSYAQSGANWILQQVTITPSLSGATVATTIKFTQVNWSGNAVKDAARAGLATTLKAPPAPVSTLPGPLPIPATDPAPAPGAQVISPPDCNSHHYLLGGTQNVALIHGINSSSCAWTRMANWLNQDFSFKDEEIPTLASTWGNSGGITAQGLQAYSIIKQSANDGAGGTNFVVLGHSMGGLAARYAAQYFQNIFVTTGTPSMVRGVVTVDSPNQGANIAESLQVITTVVFEKVGINLALKSGCILPTDNPGCFLLECFSRLVRRPTKPGAQSINPWWT